MKKSIIFSLLITITLGVFSQNSIKGKYKRLSFDIYGGMPYILGEIQNNNFSGYNLTGRLDYHITSAFSFGGEFSYGAVSGLDENGSDYFRNQYMKAFIGPDIHLYNILRFSEITKWFQPYFGFGIGAVKSDIEYSGYNGLEITDHFNDWVAAAQVHLGTKFKLAKWLDLNLRVSADYLATDWFDNYNPNITRNKSYDFLLTYDLGFSFNIGGKGKDAVIWKRDDIKDKNEQEQAEEDLAAKMDEELAENQEKLDSLEEANKALNDRMNQLADNLANLNEQLETGNLGGGAGSSNGINDLYTGADEHIYETDLSGPVKAVYYIVAGSYAIEKNAQTRVAFLEVKGYSPYIMVETHADLNRVCIDQTDSYSEAIQKVVEYREKLDPYCWIMKQRP